MNKSLLAAELINYTVYIFFLSLYSKISPKLLQRCFLISPSPLTETKAVLLDVKPPLSGRWRPAQCSMHNVGDKQMTRVLTIQPLPR